MFCNKCGKSVADDSAYCNFCGYCFVPDAEHTRQQNPSVPQCSSLQDKNALQRKANVWFVLSCIIIWIPYLMFFTIPAVIAALNAPKQPTL